MSSKRGLWLGIGLAVLGLGLAAAALLALLPSVISAVIVRRAAQYGVELDPGELGFGLDWVQLESSTLRFSGMKSLEATVARIDVSLSGLSPVSVAVGGVEVRIRAEVPEAALELHDYARAHLDAFDLPLTASNVHVTLGRQSNAPVWLEIAGGRLARQATGGVFTAERVLLGGVPVGPLAGGFTARTAHATLAFGESDLAKAPVQLTLEPGATAAQARVRLGLQPIALERLSAALGVPPLAAGVTVSSELDALVGEGDPSIVGTGHASLVGYVPPHPPELDGFVFGDTTSVDTRFSVPRTGDRVVLTDTTLAAGRFVLRGTGQVSLAADHAALTLDLGGELPCDALAEAAVQARAGQLLGAAAGALLGSAARRAVQGSVAVRVGVEADSRHWDQAKVAPRIGVGCGLVPLPLDAIGKALPDLSKLKGLPAPDLSQLPGLPSALPPLPSALPALPKGAPTLALPPLPRAPAPAASAARKGG